MRLLKFFGAFLLTAVVIFGFVIGWNWEAFTTFFENRRGMMEGTEWVTKTGSLKGLSEFMGETPQYSSFATIVIDQPDSALYYQENTPRIMGTTANIFILIAYAIQFDQGVLNPDKKVEWQAISEHQLTNIEETAHMEALNTAQERGWIDQGQITLNNALSLLAEYGDLALADYLWWQLDQSIWKDLQNTLKVDSTEMPLPYSGLYQAISPGLTQTKNQEILNRWKEEDRSSWRAYVTGLSSSYLYEPEYRNRVQEYLHENRLGNTFMEERDALTLFPKTTAREMIGIMKKLVQDILINKEVSQSVKRYLGWPMDVQPMIDQDFTQYGAIYDNRMGIMNGIDFGTSSYTGKTSVQALYMDQLPVGFWFHASGSQMHQDFMQRMIYDPAMIDQMYNVVED